MRLAPEREQELRKCCSAEYQLMLSEIDELRAELLITEGQRDDESGVLYLVIEERDQLRAENENLKKIIAKQLCDEDDLGYEYSYVITLKEENQKLRERLATWRHVLTFYADNDIYRKGFDWIDNGHRAREVLTQCDKDSKG